MWFTEVQTQPQIKWPAARKECLSNIPHLGLYIFCLRLHSCSSCITLQPCQGVEKCHHLSSQYLKCSKPHYNPQLILVPFTYARSIRFFAAYKGSNSVETVCRHQKKTKTSA